MRATLTLLAAGLLAAGCGGTIKTAGDAVTDQPDDGSETADGENACGDERTLTSPVYYGTESWDPTVVDLTDGQGLAVGALMTQRWGTWSNSCTATLVTPTLVLTAAHCVRGWWGDEPPSSFRFAVGDDVASPLHMWEPVDARSHPEYGGGGGSASHDVGVLVLPEPATVAVPDIEPIAMNCDPLDSTTIMGASVQNVGYGQTERGDNSEKWWTVEEVVDLTAYDFTVDGHGVSSVCYGDSGGPSLWTMPDGVVRVIGTVSWGDPSCVDRDHFARVDDSCTFLDGFTEECGDETWEGRCEADVAVWCEDGVLVTMDCAETGLVCGDDGTGLARCVDPAVPCGDETWEGRCEGDTAVWCEDDALVREDCAAEDLVCGDDGTGLARCIEDPCGGLTWEGRCDGDDAVWCEDGEVRTRFCADCDQVCGWVEEIGAYYCIDPD